MPDRVFIQRTRLGRSIFLLRTDTIEITSYLFGRKQEARIPLRTISIDYQIDSRRMSGPVYAAGLLCALSIAGMFFLLRQRDWPPFFAMYAGMFAVSFLWSALRFVPRLEYFTFVSHWKQPLFSIVREREQTQECEAFVTELLDRIERIEKGLPEDKSPLTHSPAFATEEENFDRPLETRWLMSIAAGAITTLTPILGRLVTGLDVIVLMVVLGATAFGLIAAGRSFIVKERKKWWSLLGIALCVLPFVLY